MGDHVGEGLLGPQPVGRGSVAVDIADDEWLADTRGGELGLEADVAGIEAPHEADLNETPATCDLGIEHRLGRCLADGEWLLAQHRLAGSKAGKRMLGVHCIGGGDEYRIDVIGANELCDARDCSGTDAPGDMPGSRLVEVIEDADRRA